VRFGWLVVSEDYEFGGGVSEELRAWWVVREGLLICIESVSRHMCTYWWT
jgi:hypothetical protein